MICCEEKDYLYKRKKKIKKSFKNLLIMCLVYFSLLFFPVFFNQILVNNTNLIIKLY